MNNILRREKFESRIKVDKNGCWIWTGMQSKTGYGQVKRDGKFLFSHRYSYMLYKGDIGKKFVLHICDVRLCVNPDHLILGTQKDNQQDMKSKGRHVYGEKSPNAKLNNRAVYKMYDLYEQGIGTIKLASMFGITKNLAWRVVKGLQWTHLYDKRYRKMVK
jgi:hypothetical protein